jgi:hypothetical protein
VDSADEWQSRPRQLARRRCQLDGGENFFHARDGGPRKRFAVELHVQAAFLRSVDLNGGCVLARATEKKIAETVASAGVVVGTSQEEGAGAIAEEAAEFAGDAIRRERAAVDIGGDHDDDLRLSRADERLRDSEGIQQPKARAANIERAAVFADEQSGMKLRRERRIMVMCFTRGDDPVELLRPARGSAQRLLRGACAERKFVLSFGGVSKRFDAGAVAQFACRHPKGTVYFL